MVYSREIIQEVKKWPYNYEVGPVAEVNPEDVPVIGINCQFLVHIFLKELLIQPGYMAIPDYYRSKEIYEDEQSLFEKVSIGATLRERDVLLFHHSPQVTDAKQLHLGLVYGVLDTSGQVKVMHTSLETAGFAIESLDAIRQRKRNRYLVAVRRPSVKFFN